MAPAVVATPLPSNSPPCMQLQVSGFPSSAASVTVVRVDTAGNQTPVRTADPADLASGSWPGFDYEPPYNQSVSYLATASSGQSATSAVRMLPVARPWLVHPGFPDRSVPLIIDSYGPRTHGTNMTVHRPLGRPNAITISDGTRQSPSNDMVVRTESLQDEEALLALLADSSPLLLQMVYDDLPRRRYLWVSVGDVTEADLVPWAGSEDTAWTLPCTVVDYPAGLLQAQFTWDDLPADYPQLTWDTVPDVFATWDDVALNNPIGS